jgi:plasmid stabilization system protein ParE
MEVLLAPQAQTQVRTIDDWWRENRTAAPDLFAEELAAALSLLARAPRLGRRYTHPTVNGVRRVLMRSTRYHLYYIIHADTVLVLSVWSGQRGAGPILSTHG